MLKFCEQFPPLLREVGYINVAFVFYPLGYNGDEEGESPFGGWELWGPTKVFLCQVLLLFPSPHSIMDLKNRKPCPQHHTVWLGWSNHNVEKVLHIVQTNPTPGPFYRSTDGERGPGCWPTSHRKWQHQAFQIASVLSIFTHLFSIMFSSMWDGQAEDKTQNASIKTSRHVFKHLTCSHVNYHNLSRFTLERAINHILEMRWA